MVKRDKQKKGDSRESDSKWDPNCNISNEKNSSILLVSCILHQAFSPPLHLLALHPPPSLHPLPALHLLWAPRLLPTLLLHPALLPQSSSTSAATISDLMAGRHRQIQGLLLMDHNILGSFTSSHWICFASYWPLFVHRGCVTYNFWSNRWRNDGLAGHNDYTAHNKMVSAGSSRKLDVPIIEPLSTNRLEQLVITSRSIVASILHLVCILHCVSSVAQWSFLPWPPSWQFELHFDGYHRPNYICHGRISERVGL